MISKQKGFSLVEVLISFLLIGISSLGLVKLQVYVEQKSDYAIQSLEALNFAERQMEYYRTRASDVSGAVGLIPFDELDDFISGTSGDRKHCLYNMDGIVGSPYTLECIVEDGPIAVSQSVRTITVTVNWTDRMDNPQSVALNTMLSKYSEFD
ncbi:MAG: type IV pilus modification PilV family protein [Vibrio cyclitrophicus]